MKTTSPELSNPNEKLIRKIKETEHEEDKVAYRKKITQDPHQDLEGDPEEDSKEDQEQDPEQDPEQELKEDPEEE